jgi:hypothetical protein
MSQEPFDPDHPAEYPDPEDIDARRDHQSITVGEAMDEETTEDGFTDESAYAPVDPPVADVMSPRESSD